MTQHSNSQSKRTLEAATADWRLLFSIAAVATLAGLALMPVQVVIFIAWPPPVTVAGFFEVLQGNALRGLLNLDLLYIVSNILLIPLYLALYVALRHGNKSLMTLALAVEFVGLAAYFSTNPSFEMLALSGQYAAATTDAGRATFLAAGEALLASYTGTAFNVYYVLDGIALLLMAAVMFRSTIFSNLTAWAGLAAGILMMVPSSAGMLGMVFAMASLLPWALFSVLVARRFLQMARD